MDIKMRTKLDRILKERNLTQKQLADMTRIRPAAISELFNNQRKSINKEHIEKIASVLEIEDVSELIEFYRYQPLFDEK